MLLRNLRLASLPVGIAAALTSPLAFAQESEASTDSSAVTLDRIEVTGTRIRQVDVETSQPVLTISRKDIEQQGFQSVADILQNISAVGTPTISRAQPLAAGESVGGTYIDLRNFGAKRTLVLINGKRLGINTNGLQDVSLIPAVIIERVEVLKDGASSIYGSDAIGGVINLITRSNFEGAQANAYYGQYGEGDGAVQKYDFVMGFGNERGSLTAAAEFAEEAVVWQSDRDISKFQFGSRHPTAGWNAISQWGHLVLPAAQGGVRVLRRGGNPYDFNDFLPQDLTAPHGDVSNPRDQSHLRTPLERKSLFVDGSYDITDSVRFRTNLLYSGRDASRTNAGYPFQSNAFASAMSADSYYNPLGVHHGAANPQAVTFRRRTWEVPRSETSSLHTFRFTAAVEGSFDIGERYFDWDIGYLHNSNKQTVNSYGDLNLANTRAAVGPSFLNPVTNRVECGTPQNPITYGSGPGSCIPWNPFIPFGRDGDGGLTNDQALQDFLFQEIHDRGETETQLYTANLAGVLFSLPAGDLAFAAGVERREETGEFVPDSASVTGGNTRLAAGPTNGAYTVEEFYAELQVPVLADAPFAKELSFNLASRYSDYTTFGDTVNSKFGFKWKPVESLLVRGTWAEGFRAPNIDELFGGGSQTFSFYADPCDTRFGASATNQAVRARCAQDIANADTFRQLAAGFVPGNQPNQQSPVPFDSGSNPLLTPELSVSKTAGLVWSPGFVQGLNMSLDWWWARIENTIVVDTPTQMLNDCYVANIASRCRTFTRDPQLGYVDDLQFGDRNAGYAEAEGFDFDLNYRRTTDFGAFALSWLSTYTSRAEIQTTNDAGALPEQGVSFLGHTAGTFRVRSNLNLSWTLGQFGVSWGARYYSAMKETCTFATECTDPDYEAGNPAQSRAINRVGSNTFHDLQLRWEAPWNATVAVGANNVFGHMGPQMYTQPNSSVPYYGGFDIGRFIYLKYQQRF